MACLARLARSRLAPYSAVCLSRMIRCQVARYATDVLTPYLELPFMDADTPILVIIRPKGNHTQ